MIVNTNKVKRNTTYGMKRTMAMEANLEDALINHIEKFLLELGKGFMFVGRQQRITFDNGTIMLTWFYSKSLCDN